MEGLGATAEQSPSPGENGQPNETSEAKTLSGEMAPKRGAVLPADGNDSLMSANMDRPRVRVDARLLEATLLNLRKRIAAIPLVFDIPGADEVTAERAKLLSQIDDYLLPRVRQSAAPLLVALVGSTGAGKSTLVNSIVGTQVSQTGVRRPTTNSPVLACHPDDIHWFAENMFLPTLPRVRQEGLARPGRDGLLVLAASEGMTKGIALLDTPDIDSVVRAHYDFAYQFLDASDLWLFMTSATRYADAPVWELLQHARDRGAALGVVLSRVPPGHRTELVDHFNAMLDANGIQTEDRFLIPETGLVDGFLPDDIFEPVRDWLTETAKHADRRVAVLSQTMAGMLDTFKVRVPRLAAHVDAQVVLRTRLRKEAETAYATALAEFDASTRDAHLLAGEVLARWQDYTASGDLGTALRSKRGLAGLRRPGKRARADGSVARYAALDTALRAALESLVLSVADRAAEQVTRVWRDNPGGAALLAAAEAKRVRGERAKREFESAFGTSRAGEGPGGPEGLEGPGASGASGASRVSREFDAAERQGAFDRSSPDLPLRVSRAISAWQDQLMRRMQPNAPQRLAPPPGRDPAPAAVLTEIAMLGEPTRTGRVPTVARDAAAREAEATQESRDEIVTVPRELLASLFGATESAALISRVREDLWQRIGLLLDEEQLRFAEIVDGAGPVDGVAAVRLYQAQYSLEAAR